MRACIGLTLVGNLCIQGFKTYFVVGSMYIDRAMTTYSNTQLQLHVRCFDNGSLQLRNTWNVMGVIKLY